MCHWRWECWRKLEDLVKYICGYIICMEVEQRPTKKRRQRRRNLSQSGKSWGCVCFLFGCTAFIWPVEGARVLQLNVEVVKLFHCWKHDKEIQVLRACKEAAARMRFKRGNKELQWRPKRGEKHTLWLKPDIMAATWTLIQPTQTEPSMSAWNKHISIPDWLVTAVNTQTNKQK